MSVLKKLLLSVVLGASLTAIAPTSVKADDYWDGYWNWYDNSYRPYYYRQQRYPNDYYYSNRYYDGYYGDGYYGNRYSPRTRYYGTPNYGYQQQYYGGGNSVQVGPLRFGWR